MKSIDEKYSYQNKQNEELNININKLNNYIRELELKNSDLKSELNEKLYIIQKETKVRLDREKDLDNINKIIKEKERELKSYIEEVESIKNENRNLYDDNTRMYNELDRLKRHIYIITDQNQQVMNSF